jgi:hypothetical protein
MLNEQKNECEQMKLSLDKIINDWRAMNKLLLGFIVGKIKKQQQQQVRM